MGIQKNHTGLSTSGTAFRVKLTGGDEGGPCSLGNHACSLATGGHGDLVVRKKIEVFPILGVRGKVCAL